MASRVRQIDPIALAAKTAIVHATPDHETPIVTAVVSALVRDPIAGIDPIALAAKTAIVHATPDHETPIVTAVAMFGGRPSLNGLKLNH
ncbi:hypothetical protein [Ferrimicrobium sp.]|uniref:hypothetical protein n=1 Tax=Ferrimicrobium sp. TaxID=2926050 RepID=UPI002608A2CC|nr:hypothetical protein [Ferrimicrobium sp.]